MPFRHITWPTAINCLTALPNNMPYFAIIHWDTEDKYLNVLHNEFGYARIWQTEREALAAIVDTPIDDARRISIHNIDGEITFFTGQNK